MKLALQLDQVNLSVFEDMWRELLKFTPKLIAVIAVLIIGWLLIKIVSFFIKKALKDADEVYFATDPDREGEAISWHLYELLKENITFDMIYAAIPDGEMGVTASDKFIAELSRGDDIFARATQSFFNLTPLN